jgi:succinyl-CoA synthetase beta subunit
MELMDYDRAHALLSRYRIKSVESKYVNSANDAISFAKGNPIVLKVLSSKALHKSRSKLVALNLWTPEAIEQSYDSLKRTAEKFRPYKIIAQKMASNGMEIIIGGKTDQQFGKMILIGLGGIYVEAFRDFALRLCPITKYDAKSMLNQLRSKSVIAPDQQSEAMIINLLLEVSRMFEANDITELDLNPVILHDGTYDAVDLRIIK